MGYLRKLKKNLLESAILGTAGLLAFGIIGIIIYVIGVIFNVPSLQKPFFEEIELVFSFPLFFILGVLIKIIIGGELIEFFATLLSKMLKMPIFVNQTIEQTIGKKIRKTIKRKRR